ncbi:MAG: PQQ-like beta-propeller repeat protein [Verrucomicrobiae bacterium]|nr:PQQ-like beta-propeller repeat protein [Verrucomicrobiae bacterium]
MPARPLATAIALLLASATGRADGDALRIVPSESPGWPQFRGPRRDAVSLETNLLRSWPEAGPPLLWQVTNIGTGYSSPIIVGDSIFVTGDIGEDLVLIALDLDGREKWRASQGRSWAKPYPGARATPTHDGGRLFLMNAHGRLACMDATTGAELWAVDVLARFGARNIQWAISECVVVDRDRVIVCPGGPGTMIAALDKRTGDTAWSSGPLRFTRTQKSGGATLDPPAPDCDTAGYASPMLFTRGDRRLVAGAAGRHYFIADADAGTLVWSHEIPTTWEVIGSIPVISGDSVIFSAPDKAETRRFRLLSDPTGIQAQLVWQSPMDNCHGGLLAHGDQLFGSGYRRSRGWSQIDARTGQFVGGTLEIAGGSALFADGRIYAFSEDGTLALLEPTPQGPRSAGTCRPPPPPGVRTPQRDAWAHPALFAGRLYIRNHAHLACYDVRARR